MDSSLKKNENYSPQIFLKEYQYIEKKVVRHIIHSDDSDEEPIKDMKVCF